MDGRRDTQDLWFAQQVVRVVEDVDANVSQGLLFHPRHGEGLNTGDAAVGLQMLLAFPADADDTDLQCGGL
ncbi:hypothetical protein NicSoilC5_04610 [Arthrobacter sp. NicSoilC5]|nr:hypothetical protein NicSoilC5_04610 [Arthrobacter sp. NicSoilC5]